MGFFRELSKLFPSSRARSLARMVGGTADKAIAHSAYEADRTAFFAEAEKTLDRTARRVSRAARNTCRNGGQFARSYFAGAIPQNGYTPSRPYTVVVIDNPYTYLNTHGEKENAHLSVLCGGSDMFRSITMRKAGDGRWYLWEHALLDGIDQSAQ